MVRIDAAQVVDVQRHPGMVDQPLEELLEQINIEGSEIDIKPQLYTGSYASEREYDGVGLRRRLYRWKTE